MTRRPSGRIGALGLAALFVVALAPARSAAQAPTLSVVPGRETEARVAPGQIFTLPFQVVNGSGEPRRLVPEIRLPEGWRAMAGTRPLALAGGAQALWLVSLGIPGTASAGASSVVLRLRPEGGGDPLYEDTLRLEVEERPRVQLRILSSPGYAVAEDTISLRFLVQNQGNASAEFRVELGSDPGLDAAHPDTVVRLAPGESADRTVTLRAGGVGRSQTSRVRVRAVGVRDTEVRDSASTEVVVVPMTRRTEGLYRHLPARLRVRGADGGQAPVMAELTGGGRLFADHGPEVAFHLRSLGGTDPLMQERDQYSVNVRGESYEARLGDQLFTTGALSGGARAGFGAGGSVTRGRVTGGGFVSSPRGEIAGPGEQSAYASYRMGDRQEVTTRLSRIEGRGEGGTLATLAYAASPFPGAEVLLEAGTGRSERGAGSGYSLDVRGDHRWLAYSVAHRSGDEALPGPFRGVRSSSGSLSVSPARGFSLGASAGQYRHEAAPSPFAYSSTGRSMTVHADLFGVVGADYRTNEWSSDASGAAHRHGEEALRLRAGGRVGPLLLNGSTEIGERTDPMTGLPVGYTDYTAMPSLTLGGAVLSAYARHLRGRGGATVPEEGWSVGANLAGPLTQHLRVSFAAASRAPAMPGRERDQRLEARLDQSLPGQHLLSLRAQRLRSDAMLGESSSLALEYSIPLKIRAGKANTPGRVVGRVTDGESGAGLGGVVVRLQDQMMVTDRAGYVVFSSVRAGAHPLNVATAGSRGQVALGDSLVLVEGASAPRPFHLRMVAGAQVRGSVRLLASATSTGPGDGLVDGAGLENIVLLLESPTDTVFLVTDPHGNFDAGRIRPGRWTISHVGGSLPALYAFERSRVEFMVAAGEDREIRLVVRPKHRDIQMIATGEVLVMAAPAPVEQRVMPAQPTPGTITAVAVRGVAVKPAIAAPAPATTVAANTSAGPSEPWRPRTAAFALELSTAPYVAGSTAPVGDDRSSASPAAAALAIAFAPDAPFRSTPAETPHPHTAPTLSRRDGEDDPPDRPPPRDGRIPWDPPPRDHRVPWDPPPDTGRAPPGWMIQQDPPPTRAGPDRSG